MRRPTWSHTEHIKNWWQYISLYLHMKNEITLMAVGGFKPVTFTFSED